MHRNFKIFILLALPLLLPAQNWQQIEGVYARVAYLPHLGKTADSLLAIADRVLPRLAALQGVPIGDFKKEKAHIILTDAPDVTNGFAISNTVVIYARSSSYLNFWSGPHRWYKMVLEHELAHHVTFRAIWRRANYLGLVASAGVPRWFMEGIAQYLAETWTAFRGDVFLKRAVLNGRFTYTSLNDLSNGRLLYAAGHAYVRYLATEYGDSSLIRLMHYDSTAVFYDFDEAFKTVYKKSPQDLFPWFIRHMIIHYGNEAADYPRLKFTSTLPDFGYRDNQIMPIRNADSTWLVSTVAQKNHLYRTAAIYQIKNGETNRLQIISDDYDTRLFISSDAQRIAFGRYALGVTADQQQIRYDWFVYDRMTDKTRCVVKNIRAVNAAFDNRNRLLLAVVQADSSYIYRFKDQNPGTIIFRSGLPIGQLAVDKKGSVLFEMQRINTHRDLFMLTNKGVRALTNDSLDFRNFVFLNDTLLAFNGMQNRNPAIWLYNRHTGAQQMIIDGSFSLQLEGYDPAHNSLLLAYLDPGNNPQFVTMALDSISARPLIPHKRDINPRFSDWIRKQAQADSIPGQLSGQRQKPSSSPVLFPQGNLINALTLALPYKESNTGWGLLLTSAWIEPMQRQLLAVNALVYPDDWENSFVSFAHTLRFANLQLQSFYYHGPTIFSSFKNGYLAQIHDVAAMQLGINRYVNGNRRSPYTVFGGYSYSNIYDPDTRSSYHYQGPSLSADIGWQKPSRYASVFPKQALFLQMAYFKSISRPYDFSVFQLHGQAAGNLYFEELGLTLKAAYIQSNGAVPPSGLTGLDRYYNFDIPRDYRYTQTVRGIDRDVLGNRLVWASGNIAYYLAQDSGLTLLFLPLTDVALSVFSDAARVWDGSRTRDALGVGGELSFGYPGLRFAAGYARAVLGGDKLPDRWYGRLSLELNGIAGMRLK